MIATRAVKDGDGWRISRPQDLDEQRAGRGLLRPVRRHGCGRAPRRSVAVSPRSSCRPSAQGFTVQRVIRLFGHIGGDEAELALEDLRVEPWQIVGELDDGFAAALYGVSLGRIYNSARAVGYGRWAIEAALEYAKTRDAFGSVIANYQGVTFPLAESATELHAAHLMGLNAATLIDQGAAAVKELSMCKAYSVQVGFRAVDRAIQTHGAMGFTNELGLTHAWHSLRIVNVADGTNEILNRTIAQRLLKGDVEL